ncbi:hypothetical protein B0H17DRAFT_285885 [Mycena rosella]|uniref:Uncharacterized protein n=1 Tax=Mycena rosella TaxID=1033263 RepID=A0AAD7CWN2_MYCRO|nr:hypothetical protein B0H17DRAFT_285885 [Mycena rosella]
MLEHSQDFHATLHHMSPNLKMISGLISAEGASQLQVLAHASLLDPVVWIKNVWSFVNDSEDYWDSARHNILSGFLDGSLSLYNRPNTVYKFDSTLKIFQTNKLPPPSALQTKNYAELLEGDAIWERPSEGHGLPNPHATSALAVVISIVFPVSSTSRPVIGLDGINNMISYIRAMMRSSHEVLRTVLDDANNTLLWASIMEYLSCGCPRSYTAERTLEVMCDFYQWLSQTYSLMDPNDRSELDRHSERLPRFNESTLLALEPPHVCPSYYSILAIVKTRILLSLMNQRTKIFERLDKGEIIAFSPEFHERLAERWRLLRGTPLTDAETSFFMIPRLPSNSENLVPTQSDWNESISLLSHPLLSKSSLGEVVENDPNFDFEACDDDVQKGAQYLHLLFIVSGRLHDASADVHAGFLEACASRDPPYSTLNILTNHVRIPVSNILLAHPTHRNRFANSIQALMKVRSPTRKQTMIWQHLLRESSILGDTLKHPEPFSRTIRAYGGGYDQTAVLVIKGALREYAKSIRESSDAATSMKERVQDRLQDLDAFLDQIHTVGAIPVVVPKAGVR